MIHLARAFDSQPTVYADYAKSKVAQLQAAVAQALQRVDVIEKNIEHLRLQKEKLEFESQLTRAKEWYAELLTRYSSKSEEMLRLWRHQENYH